VILVTGGSRSGKSAYAQKLAESLPGARAFVATAPLIDEEMRDRVLRHQKARAGSAGWSTIEEPVALARALGDARRFDVLLVDCLTLWINNLMFEAEKQGRKIEEEEIEQLCRELLNALSGHPGTVVFVTNEVGMGIVPENALARRYRDLVGRCNQTIAGGADMVTFVACGIPLHLKQG
jgi:adenosylcobinamide kinase/adenosylcobinamide-phosphate guanylyltransferase